MTDLHFFACFSLKMSHSATDDYLGLHDSWRGTMDLVQINSQRLMVMWNLQVSHRIAASVYRSSTWNSKHIKPYKWFCFCECTYNVLRRWTFAIMIIRTYSKVLLFVVCSFDFEYALINMVLKVHLHTMYIILYRIGSLWTHIFNALSLSSCISVEAVI